MRRTSANFSFQKDRTRLHLCKHFIFSPLFTLHCALCYQRALSGVRRFVYRCFIVSIRSAISFNLAQKHTWSAHSADVGLHQRNLSISFLGHDPVCFFLFFLNHTLPALSVSSVRQGELQRQNAPIHLREETLFNVIWKSTDVSFGFKFLHMMSATKKSKSPECFISLGRNPGEELWDFSQPDGGILQHQFWHHYGGTEGKFSYIIVLGLDSFPRMQSAFSVLVVLCVC